LHDVLLLRKLMIAKEREQEQEKKKKMGLCEFEFVGFWLWRVNIKGEERLG